MPKVQIHEHTTSYHAITTKSPHGFQCLKKLFLEYDSGNPSRPALEGLLARDFTDNENESERSIGREEAIVNIASSRQRCSRHQIDLKRAICIEHDAKRHEVLFEGVRFMLFSSDRNREVEIPVVADKGEWIRVPFSGRIEVRVKENKFSMKDAVIEIVSRRWTIDNSQLVKREIVARKPVEPGSDTGPVSPMSNASGSLQMTQSTSTPQIGLPGGVSELPAALSGLIMTDSKSLPPYPHSATGTSTVSGSSIDGGDKILRT
ncbi:hypothetical protein CLCR_06035 [Cladophialophora carrionii]|uniref:Uncharacterized protein n=1 Tax=Cladophialophora carrionii TaxID=86049 RepID=A0A1C1CA31_9EURO|nr:hypothetical protein CLCR_06035 [Cladophialophora carrionii]